MRGEAVEVDGAMVQMLQAEDVRAAPADRDADRRGREQTERPRRGAELGDSMMTIGGGRPDSTWCAALAFGPCSPTARSAGWARASRPPDRVSPSSSTACTRATGSGQRTAGRGRVTSAHRAVHERRCGVSRYTKTTWSGRRRDRPLLDGDLLRAFAWTGAGAEIREPLDITRGERAERGSCTPRWDRAWPRKLASSRKSVRCSEHDDELIA